MSHLKLTEKQIKNLLKRVDDKSDCWIIDCNSRYPIVNINGQIYKAHRISYLIHNNYIDDNLMVCHKCDNTKCINPSHLFQDTQSANIKDSVIKNRFFIKNGELSNLSKLKESDIIQILESKSSAKEISEIYNIDVSYVYKIRKKQVWKHI